MFIIGDVHGCYLTLCQLLDKLPVHAKICFVGDIIDRGPRSLEVFKLILDRGYDSILGNHEFMALDSYRSTRIDSILAKNFWISRCGGAATLSSFNSSDKVSPAFAEFLRWSDLLPHSRCYEEEGRSLIVSHSLVLAGLGQPNEKDHALWYREPCVHDENLFEGGKVTSMYNVFGHTPIKPDEKGGYPPFIGKRYACIDTGAVYHGKLTALEFPSMTVISQDCVD